MQSGHMKDVLDDAISTGKKDFIFIWEKIFRITQSSLLKNDAKHNERFSSQTNANISETRDNGSELSSSKILL